MRSGHPLMMMFVVAGATVSLAGCGEDLGSCDMTAAKQVYYLGGVPYYAGQAIVRQSCAGGVCHASSATGGGRNGAPHGLNFDVDPLLASSSTHDVEVLASGVHRIRAEADEMYAQVKDGDMPPGKAGERPELAWQQKSGSTLVAAMLPDVKKDGQGVLRNWLACDAPMVAYTAPTAPGQDKQLGDTLTGSTASVEPTFASIYANVLGGTCLTCHNAMDGNPYKGVQALDFTTADTAYDSLVGKDAFAGGACKSNGKLVVANDCANSLLHQKLLATVPCGDRMPLAAPPLPDDTIKAICDWIDAGAQK